MNCRDLIAASLSVVLASLAPVAHAAGDTNASVSAIPGLTQHTAPLDASLRSLRAGILKDAKECTDAASSMDATAQYHADIRKTVETPNIVGFEVTGDSQCDGAHPNAYQYGISYRIKDGKRFDLNDVYAVGHRDGGSLFLTKESVVPVMAEFKRINAGRPDCLDASSANDEYLMSKAFTLAVRTDGSLQFYFDTAYVEAACFTPIRLEPPAVSAFKDKKRAAEYGLP
jgi:cellulase/cellobiase CelA1